MLARSKVVRFDEFRGFLMSDFPISVYIIFNLFL